MFFYSQEYRNGSSHSRARGNDVYYEGLMKEKSINNVLLIEVLFIFSSTQRK